MLQCNETISECTESESSEQYYECTDQLTYNDKIDATNPDPTIQQPYFETKLPDESTITTNVPLSNISLPKQVATDRKISEACKIDENLINVAFAKNIKPELSDIQNDQTVKSSHIQSSEPEDIIKCLDAKIEVSDDMEPPLITDSPEEVNQADQKHGTCSISRKVSVDVNIPHISRKDSVGMPNIINSVILNKEPVQPPIISRQQSVEPGIEASEVVLREMTSNLQQSIPVNQKLIEPQHISIEQQNPPQNVEVIQPKTTTEPVPVKKNQAITSEFDLNEQLQKILGISADKAIRSENVDGTKETHSLQTSHSKIELQTNLSQSIPTSQQPITHNVENTSQKPKIQMKIPNVKIDSPESNHKAKLGNFEHTGPKRLSSVVESVEQHVAFGFKATLIRTLGNLCWKNQINKRQVIKLFFIKFMCIFYFNKDFILQIRELEVIPLLLDCCNIDARNPCILFIIF